MNSEEVKLEAELRCITKPDGSARFSINNTIQICAVNGPGEVKLMKEIADRACVNFIYKTRIGINSYREKVIEYSLKSLIESLILTNIHPRTAINIILQEIQNDSNCISCAINCTCLALLDANIPMNCLFASVSCVLTNKENCVFYFPSKKNENLKSSATFVFDSIEKDILSVSMDGTFEIDDFNHLFNNSKKFAQDKIFPFYTKLIKEKKLE